MPLFQMVKFVNQPGRMRKVKKARAAGFFAVAAAIIAGVLLIPTPMRVQGTLVLTVAEPAIVYPEVEGQVSSRSSSATATTSRRPASRSRADQPRRSSASAWP